MRKLIVIVAVSMCIISCKKDKENINVNSSANIENTTQKGSILIEELPFPEEVTECACYFAKDQSDFNSEKYIYVDDAGENAFAKLDGERRTMKLISSSSFEDDSESIIKEIESNEYKISIKAKKIKENPEAMVFEGTMTVEQPTGEKVTTPIYGECAC